MNCFQRDVRDILSSARSNWNQKNGWSFEITKNIVDIGIIDHHAKLINVNHSYFIISFIICDYFLIYVSNDLKWLEMQQKRMWSLGVFLGEVKNLNFQATSNISSVFFCSARIWKWLNFTRIVKKNQLV